MKVRLLPIFQDASSERHKNEFVGWRRGNVALRATKLFQPEKPERSEHAAKTKPTPATNHKIETIVTSAYSRSAPNGV